MVQRPDGSYTPWAFVVVADGVVDNVIASNALELIVFDCDILDTSDDAEYMIEYYVSRLNALRERVPPGPARKKIRRIITQTFQLTWAYESYREGWIEKLNGDG